MRVLRLGAASLPIVAAFTVVGVASRVGPVTGACVQASSAHHATLVVEHVSGATVRVCVPFSEVQITGEELLRRSGVEYSTQTYSGTGDAVCQVDNEPTQYTNCFQDGKYWAMFVSRNGSAWAFATRGVSQQMFGDGDAEGFRYQGQGNSSPPPSPAGVCPPPVQATSPPATTSAPTSAHPGPTRSAGSQSMSLVPGRAIAGTTTPSHATSPGAASPAASSAPPVAAQTRAGPSPPTSSGGGNAGVWVAAALGAVLIILLVVQLARPRRSRTRP